MEERKFGTMKAIGAVIVLLGILLAVGAFEQGHLSRLVELYGDRALELWAAPMVTIGNLQVSPVTVVKSTLFLILLIFLARLARRFVRTKVLVHTSIDAGLRYAIEVGTGYLVFILGLVIGLQSVGLNLSSLAFLTGIVGVGVGFGLQNIVNNFVSGLILLVERPIKVNDRVEIGDLTGDIVRIAARSTWVRTNDNVVIIVPNSDLIASRVTNWTANDQHVRVNVPLGVSYSCDPLQIRELLLEVARNQPGILTQPAPDVIFKGFGDSSLDFELRVWTEQYLRAPQVLKSHLYFAIFQAFTAHNIEIPFPQRDIHVRSLPPRLAQLADAR